MKFSEKLLCWYEKNKRDLPWRNTQNPYFIWLSEIILQQTRIEQGLPYYLKFIKRFPTVTRLAAAGEDEVLKLWQGLGYYTRARNLHQSAKIICQKHGAKFPENYEDILKLKGVGKYTVAAIASFAYNLPYPVIDGNVQRVLARIFNVDEPINSSRAEKRFYTLAGELIDRKNPGTFNQAIMEFGAIHCSPSAPGCGTCIFRQNCIAFKTNRVGELPVRQKKSEQRSRYFNYLLIRKKDTVFLSKRNGNDIWKNLYEFPLIETENQVNAKQLVDLPALKNILGETGYQVNSLAQSHRHVLSHQVIYARFWEITLKGKSGMRGMKSFLEIKKSELKNFAVPRLIDRYIEENNLRRS